MAKRPSVDLSALTSEAAAPMPEAAQRAAGPVAATTAQGATATTPARALAKRATAAPEPVRTANLQALAFKVSPAFRRRFRQRAANADLKLNELLFAALEAWEEKHQLKR